MVEQRTIALVKKRLQGTTQEYLAIEVNVDSSKFKANDIVDVVIRKKKER